nr:hypothetical protein [Bacteroidota bacterium]
KQLSRSDNMIDYIPMQAKILVKIPNFETTKTDIAINTLLPQLKNAAIYDFFKNRSEIVSNIHPKGESVLIFTDNNDSLSETIFITKNHPEVYTRDSLSPLKTSIYKKYTLTERAGSKITTAIIDSMFVLSTSATIMKDIIDGKKLEDSLTSKLFNIDQEDQMVIITTPKVTQVSDSTTIQLASRTLVKMDLSPEGIVASGVMINQDSLPKMTEIFKGLVAKRNSISTITPISAKQVRVLTCSDTEILSSNLSKFHGAQFALDPVFETVDEIGSISFTEGTVIAIKSIELETTQEMLQPLLTDAGTFRETRLYAIEGAGDFFTPFYPLIDQIDPEFVFQLGGFYIFSSSEGMAQKIITDYGNNATLSKAPYYENSVSQLSKSSSFSVFNLNGVLDSWMAPVLGVEESALKNHPLAVFQLSQDRDFTHVNLVCKEASKNASVSIGVAQVFATKLESPVLRGPQFFTNHRTKGKDIVVQDSNLNLYLLSSSGKVLWKKQLKYPILGEIQEIDILKNGKKQLAFATEKSLFILDRNGNPVGPFPKKFNNKITQPLSVFDYDNKRNYRFVVTQGKKVFMYDSKGKIVNGFTFKKAESKIVHAPRHIRMRTKDYIVIPEENGTLNLLSRTGKERVNVGKTFQFSDIPISKEGNDFVVITKDNSKKSISQKGKITTRSLAVSSNYWFDIKGATKVTLDENLLRINGKLIELPYGTYTRPSIYISSRGTLVTVTEIQEKKVYIYSKDGSLLPGFPVYGTEKATLSQFKNTTLLTTTTGPNEVAMYRFR